MLPSVRHSSRRRRVRSRKSNLVSKLAEALGRALYDNYGPGSVSDPTRLRDANNSFRYATPDRLSPSAPDNRLAAEPHSFSRIFTGAFYDTLIWLVARELKRESSEAALERARRLAGRILGRAVETVPPGDARYATVAARMRDIDQTEEGGVASLGIEQAFARHGIRLAPLPVSRRSQARPGPYRALRALDPDRPGGAAALRAALHVPPGARIERTSLPARVGGGVREQFIHRDAIEVRDRSLGRLSGVTVRIHCGCTLTRGPSGDVEGASLAPHPHPSPAEVARQLKAGWRWTRSRSQAAERPRGAAATSSGIESRSA